MNSHLRGAWPRTDIEAVSICAPANRASFDRTSMSITEDLMCINAHSLDQGILAN
jgi:hypothetical protein